MAEMHLRTGEICLLDAVDYERLADTRWEGFRTKYTTYAILRQYVGTINGKQKYTRKWLHREILGCPAGLFVDHINGDGLDNRRDNLRVCTKKENQRNLRMSAKKQGVPFKGVDRAMSGKFRARIWADGKSRHLGCFTTVVEAALAYDHAAKQMFGEFARLNFPNGSPVLHDDA